MKDRLWAPWRLAYIKDDKARKKGCPFCTLPRSAPSEATLVLWRNDDIAVLMNKFPYNPGHLLVVPRRHAGDPTDLEPGVWEATTRAVRACVEILKKDSKPAGFNIGMNLGHAGGAGIPQHLHWHVLPRWDGDTNFMPLLAETKAIPTHNETVYRRLKPLFAGFEKKLAPAKLKSR